MMRDNKFLPLQYPSGILLKLLGIVLLLKRMQQKVTILIMMAVAYNETTSRCRLRANVAASKKSSFLDGNGYYSDKVLIHASLSSKSVFFMFTMFFTKPN